MPGLLCKDPQFKWPLLFCLVMVTVDVWCSQHCSARWLWLTCVTRGLVRFGLCLICMFLYFITYSTSVAILTSILIDAMYVNMCVISLLLYLRDGVVRMLIPQWWKSLCSTSRMSPVSVTLQNTDFSDSSSHFDTVMTVNFKQLIRFWRSVVPAIKQVFVNAAHTWTLMYDFCLNHGGRLYVLMWIML